MKYNLKFQAIEGTLKRIQSEFDNLREKMDDAAEYTMEFLNECKKAGIKRVSIGMADEEIKSTKGWPFGCESSVFADGDDKNGWPKIWGVVESLGIGGGCGNSGQHQISGESYARLVDGVYSYKDGKWSLKEST